MLTIERLTINALKQPLGVGERPTVSWHLSSSQRNTLQIAYRIQLMQGQQFQWDSGKVLTDKNSFIPLMPAESWQSNCEYRVHVTVWDNHHGAATAETKFTTSLLAPGDWQAQWRTVNRPYYVRKKGFSHQPPESLFRQVFKLGDKKIKCAHLFATALGIYRLSVNGTSPDNRELAPGHTAYRRVLNFQEYDVTKLLKSGQNVLGMEVGDGWYCNPQTMPPIEGLKPEHAVLFQLQIEYTDGTSTVIASGNQTQWQPGPVRADDLYAGEMYDANAELTGWDTDANVTGWQPTEATDYPMDNLQPQEGIPVRTIIELKPKQLLHAPNGDMIIDFGQVIAGVVRFKVDEPKGHQVSLEHTEVLDKNGNYYINTRSALGVTEQKDIYVSAGHPATFTPHFTYHGFRYVRVKGFSNVQLDNFTALVWSSTGDQLGTFACSSAKLNRLYQNVIWSQRANFLSIPTDCPQREKAGWTGDVWVYGRTALENANETPLLTEWLRSLAADQGENQGIVTFTCPDTNQYHGAGVKMGQQFGCNGIVNSSGWGDVAIHLPMTMYRLTDNLEIIRTQYHSMREWGEYIIRQARIRKPGSTLPDKIEQHLWNTGFQYGEWLIPSQATDSEDFKQIIANMAKSSCYTAPLIGWLSMVELAMAAQLLGQTADVAKYQAEADLMKYAIQHGGVIDDQGQMPSDLMGAYVLPIALNLVPDKFKQIFAKRLCQSLADNDYRLDTGFIGTPFLLDALNKIGRRDLAYRVLFSDRTPGWLAEVNRGATTIWENWISYDEKGNPLPTSFNHYANGCVADWMFKDIGGLDQERDDHGFRNLVFAPHVGYGITGAKRTYITSQGLAACSWLVRDNHFQMSVTVPANSRARIELPDGSHHKVGSGNYKYECQVN